MEQDHDLLVRIDERVLQLTAAYNLRAVTQDQEMKELRADVDGLRTSRAQFYAVAGVISFAISLLIRLFWR